MQTKALSLTVGALLLSTGAVSAATVTDNLNVRSGPGIGYSVIDWMPAGSAVRVLKCGPSWCRVAWMGTKGYSSRQFISSGGPSYAAAPTAGVVAYNAGYPASYYGGYANRSYVTGRPTLVPRYYGAYTAGYSGGYYGGYGSYAAAYPASSYGGYANRSYVTGRPTLLPRYYNAGWASR